MADIGIVGYGFVGKSLDHIFQDQHQTAFYDIDEELHSNPKYRPLDKLAKNSEYLFICLPTPSDFDTERGGIDLSIIDNSLEKITKHTDNTNKIITIKSTVTPGTTSHYISKYPQSNFCFNPEFLREAHYLEDAENPDRIVLGAEDRTIVERISNLYRKRFPETPIHKMGTKEAEMVKYMANSLLATKVLFGNVIYDLCDKIEVDYDTVKEAVTADKRIGSSHLDVTEERGFGGKCFPKDLVALINYFEDKGVDPSLLKEVWGKNLDIRKVRDWEDIEGAVKE